jgi:hypothetical protein
MTESNSITWSSYDTHKIQIESELRWKIAEVIEQKIDASRTAGISNHFISGLELAKAVVLDLHTKEEIIKEHPELF